MSFTKYDLLNTAWCQKFTYKQMLDFFAGANVFEVPTEQEYNTYFYDRTEIK